MLNRGGFSSIAGVAGITLTDDGGGGDGNVNFQPLDTIVNNYQTNFNTNVAFSFRQEIPLISTAVMN